MLADFEKEMEKFLESEVFDMKPLNNNNSNQLIQQDKIVENFQNYLNATKTKTNLAKSSPSNSQIKQAQNQQQQATPNLQLKTQLTSKEEQPNASSPSIIANRPEQLTSISSPNNNNKKAQSTLSPDLKEKGKAKTKGEGAESNTVNAIIKKKEETLLPIIDEEIEQSISKPLENAEEMEIKHSNIDFEKLVAEEEAKGTYNVSKEEEPKEVKFKYVKKPKYIDKYKITEPTTEAPKYKYYADRFRQKEPPYSSSKEQEQMAPIANNESTHYPKRPKSNTKVNKEKESSISFTHNKALKEPTEEGMKGKRTDLIGASTLKQDEKAAKEKKKINQFSNPNDDLDSIEIEYNQIINDLEYKEVKSVTAKPLNNNKQTKGKINSSIKTTEEKAIEKESIKEEDNNNMLNFENDDVNITLTKRPISSTKKIERKAFNSNTITKAVPAAQNQTMIINTFENMDFNINAINNNLLEFKEGKIVSSVEKQFNTIPIGNANDLIKNEDGNNDDVDNIYREETKPNNSGQILKLVNERNTQQKTKENSMSKRVIEDSNVIPSKINQKVENKRNANNKQQKLKILNSISELDMNNKGNSEESNYTKTTIPTNSLMLQNNAKAKINDMSDTTSTLNGTKKLNDVTFYSKNNKSIEEDCENFELEQQQENNNQLQPSNQQYQYQPKENINQIFKSNKRMLREQKQQQQEEDLQLELQAKITELTQNVKLVKEENEKLTNTKAEYNRLTAQLRLDIDEFQRQKEKERNEFKRFKEEECNRLEKEIKTQQKNFKQMQAMIPSKREREELSSIKEQYAKLQDDTKQKESRNKKVMDRIKRQYDEALERINELEKELKIKDEELINLKLFHKPSNQQHNDKGLKPPPSKKNHKRQSSKDKDHNNNHPQQIIEGINQHYEDTLKLTENSSAQRNKTLKRNNSLTDKSPFKMNQFEEDQHQHQHQGMSNKTTNKDNKLFLPDGDHHQMQFDNLQDNHPDEDYEMTFEDEYHFPPMNQTPLIKQEITPDGKIIKIYENNRKEIIFPSGLRKEVFPDGYQVTYLTNKDIRKLYPNGKEVYKYHESNTIQTKFPDGLQVFKFSNGQLEKNFVDGTKIINYPDGTIRNVYPDNYEEIFFPDGSLQKKDSNGVMTIDHVDGKKDTIYPDGSKISEFPDGRITKIEKDGTGHNYYK